MVNVRFPLALLVGVLVACGGDDRTGGGDVYRFDPEGPADGGRVDSGMPRDATVERDARSSGQLGDPCTTTTDCQSALVCRTGACATRQSEGGACTEDEHCEAGLECLMGACGNRPAEVCSGPGPGGECVLRVPVGSFGPLTAECMPRCSAETAAAYRACDSSSCRTAVLDADDTPGRDYFIGSAPVTTPLDCLGCATYQEFHCWSLVCESEVDDYVDHCIAGLEPSLCDPSLWAIDDCLAALGPTAQAIVETCLDSADGPPGCFACE